MPLPALNRVLDQRHETFIMAMRVLQEKGDFTSKLSARLPAKTTGCLVDPLSCAWEEALGFPLLVIVRCLKFRAGFVEAPKGFELDSFEIIRIARSNGNPTGRTDRLRFIRRIDRETAIRTLHCLRLSPSVYARPTTGASKLLKRPKVGRNAENWGPRGFFDPVFNTRRAHFSDTNNRKSAT
jgi:hypothetical protein